MPVSSPSYFPPQRSDGSVIGQTAGVSATGDRCFFAGQNAGQWTDINDIIAIGNAAFDAGTSASHITDTDLTGSIFIGNTVASALVASTVVGETRPNTMIGFEVAKVALNGGGNTLVGADVLASYVGLAADPNGAIRNMVAIGDEVLAVMNGTPGLQGGPTNSVVIGTRAFKCSNAASEIDSTVTIGFESMSAWAGGLSHENVVIGWRAGQSLGHSNNGTSIGNVLIGSQVTPTGRLPIFNVVIGQGCTFANFGASTTGADGCVAIGSGITSIGGDGNTLLGSRIIGPASGTRNIYLGASAGTSVGTQSSLFLVESNYQAVHHAILYGDMSAGNLISGLSTTGVDRAWGTGATNILKLLNGTIGNATTRVGGGYFYVSAGALHWVGSAGTDTTIAPA